MGRPSRLKRPEFCRPRRSSTLVRAQGVELNYGGMMNTSCRDLYSVNTRLRGRSVAGLENRATFPS